MGEKLRRVFGLELVEGLQPLLDVKMEVNIASPVF
jgi:hypothetical protein